MRRRFISSLMVWRAFRRRGTVASRAALLAASCTVATGDARADDVAAARRHFAEGVRLLELGDYEGARRLFKQAEVSHHAPAIIYNIAIVEEHLAHPQAAVDAYEAYVAEAGDRAELSAAAKTAIVQIKARSTRLLIETEPPGARLFVNGAALMTPSPAGYLVAAGHHVVVAEGQGWRGEESVEVQGVGDSLTVVVRVARSAPDTLRATAPPPLPVADGTPETPRGPTGLVWGASFAVAPYHLFGSTKGSNQRDATQVVAGAMVELGGAVSDRLELLGRGFFAVGPEAKPAEGAPFTYAFMGGPSMSLRLLPWWFGATFLVGRLETVAHDAFYGTDLVFGAMGEVSLAAFASSSGQYLVGVQPGALVASSNDNTAFFLPISFGYRAY